MSSIVNGFHHVMVRSTDLDKSIAFWTEGLGCEVAASWGEGDNRAVLVDVGQRNYVEIFAGGEADMPEGAIRHVALRTTDVEAAVGRAVAAGAEVTVPVKAVDIPAKPQTIPVRLAFVRGPDDVTIEFFANERT